LDVLELIDNDSNKMDVDEKTDTLTPLKDQPKYRSKMQLIQNARKTIYYALLFLNTEYMRKFVDQPSNIQNLLQVFKEWSASKYLKYLPWGQVSICAKRLIQNSKTHELKSLAKEVLEAKVDGLSSQLSMENVLRFSDSCQVLLLIMRITLIRYSMRQGS
jgi:hypothetical protein